MHKMTEHELLAAISQVESDATSYGDEYQSINEKLLKAYNSEPYGDEVEDRSQVVTNDVANVVESDMPQLARIFLGSQRPLEFATNSTNPQAQDEAEQKTLYINHLIHDQDWSYNTIFSWMKEAEIQKAGIVKYFAEDCKKVEYHEYENVSGDELAVIEQSLDGEDVKKITIESTTEESENGLFDVSFKVVRESSDIKIINIPTESFIISKNATSKNDAEIVGDRIERTRGDLLSQGFDKDLIDQLPALNSDSGKSGSMDYLRNKDIGGQSSAKVQDWASELVEIRDLYVRIDFDGDGIAERRHIMKSGNTILINEPFNHVPYAILCGVPMPHRAIGKSRAELVQQSQRVKTVLTRQILDNIYRVNNPRHVMHPDVNTNDMLNQQLGGLVRLKSNTTILPQQATMTLETPYIGDRALQVLQYWDAERAQITGVNLASQGLDSDAISRETATRFTGVQQAGEAKLELVARNFAEGGFKELYEGVAWMAEHYQNAELEMMITGKELKVNPSSWKHKSIVISKVGLGAVGNQQASASLQGILAIQQQLAATGSPLVDQVKLYSTLDEITSSLGFKDTAKFFNNPENPIELVHAENQILKQTVEQLQMAVQQLQMQAQNPLREAEEIKAQAKLIEAQQKAQIAAAKLQEDSRQFDVETMRKADETNKKIAVDLTKIEADSGIDVEGSII